MLRAYFDESRIPEFSPMTEQEWTGWDCDGARGEEGGLKVLLQQYHRVDQEGARINRKKNKKSPPVACKLVLERGSQCGGKGRCRGEQCNLCK